MWCRGSLTFLPWILRSLVSSAFGITCCYKTIILKYSSLWPLCVSWERPSCSKIHQESCPASRTFKESSRSASVSSTHNTCKHHFPRILSHSPTQQIKCDNPCLIVISYRRDPGKLPCCGSSCGRRDASNYQCLIWWPCLERPAIIIPRFCWC